MMGENGNTQTPAPYYNCDTGVKPSQTRDYADKYQRIHTTARTYIARPIHNSTPSIQFRR